MKYFRLSQQISKSGIAIACLLGLIGLVSITNSCKDDENTVITDPNLPALTTSAVTDITLTTAKCGGKITSMGISGVMERGVCWSTHPKPTLDDTFTSDGYGTGSFTSYLTDLSVGTIYYVRAYATNLKGTAYGNERVFSTVQVNLPVLTTTVATAITANSASSGGNITSDGGSDITDRGVCWSTSANPTIANSKSSDGTGKGVFSSAIKGLSANTTYYARAYATNMGGTGYGNLISFKSTNSINVSKTETNRVALLEDYGGVRSTYSPDAHTIAKGIMNANPGKFIVIEVHSSGLYSNPQTGWPDYTTPYGDALNSEAGVNAYPMGTFNRILSSTLGVAGDKYCISRNNWSTATSLVINMSAPVNIGTKVTYNSTTRNLNVEVYLYYTDAVSGSNNINVAILQDKIIGKQRTSSGEVDDYEQNNVLRDLITGQWGDVISGTGINKGEVISKSYSYTVPEYYNGSTADGGGAVVIGNLKLVVFVSNGHTNILNAVSVPVN